MPTYYHVSRVDLGELVELIPKIPDSRGPKECSVTPRVCFAPTVIQCLVGATGTDGLDGIASELLYHGKPTNLPNPVVYWTRRKLFQPEIVSDYELTGEMWALAAIPVKRKGYVCAKHFMLTGSVKIVQNSHSNISDDFIAGWKARGRIMSKCFRTAKKKTSAKP